MGHFDAIVVGGGIAGLSVARALRRAGLGTVLLLEREARLSIHSSARNAAIWLPVEGTTVALARRTAAIFDEVTESSWLRPLPALLVARDCDDLADFHDPEIRTERITTTEATSLSPALEHGRFDSVHLIDGAGVIDIDRATGALASAARGAGVIVRTGLGVRRILREGDRIAGVLCDDGNRLACAVVVDACGAWASDLGARADVSMPLSPLRRHLVHLRHAGPGRAIVWSLRDEVYFRPESGGVLASPGDEDPHPAGVPATDPRQIERLAETLPRLAPGLAGAGVRRAWACLRTFAADRELVLGPDPRLSGLRWMAGFGGRGMTVAPAAGEALAGWLAAGVRPGDCAPFDAARLLRD